MAKLKIERFKIECTPKRKNLVKFEAKRFFEPELSFDNEDSKNWFNEEVGKIGLFGVGSRLEDCRQKIVIVLIMPLQLSKKAQTMQGLFVKDFHTDLPDFSDVH